MKTAISIPDELFQEAEALSRKLGKSRSQLYADAVRLFVATHDPDAITQSLNELADELNADSAWAVASSEQTLRRVEWR